MYLIYIIIARKIVRCITISKMKASRTPNFVHSMLYDYISKHVQDSVKNLVLFFDDSAGGQKKNFTIVMFLSWFSAQMNNNIKHYYPIRGHPYNICDRNFGMYSRQVRKCERLETMHDYVQVIQKTRSNPQPFDTIPFVLRTFVTGRKHWHRSVTLFRKIKIRVSSQYRSTECCSIRPWLLVPVRLIFLLSPPSKFYK